MTDDEITDATISKVAKNYDYDEEEFNYLIVGVITERLGIDNEFVTRDP